MCTDLKKLNATMRKYHFFILLINEMLEKQHGKPFFGFLNVFSSYYQIIVSQEDQEKTIFTYPFGTLAHKHMMSFGLCDAPYTFKRYIVSIFLELIENCIEIFMDDFIVYGNSFHQY